jgi:hypothetical protein
MKKCTLCVDKIYNETLPQESRVPACVSTCPAGARHFGDLGDPDSDVSRLVEARGGFALMPEQGCKPVNRYLPPRPKRADGGGGAGQAELSAPRLSPAVNGEGEGQDDQAAGVIARWVDRILSR